MSAEVVELAEAIKQRGRRSTHELPPLLQQAEQLAQDENLSALSRALAHRAAGNARQLMNAFDQALCSYDCAISMLEKLDEPEELGRTLHAKVGLLNFMCRFDELLECADRARALFESRGDRHRLGRLDANLSHAYNRLNRFDMVLRFAEKAMPALREAGDREGYMVALTNSAVALMLMSDFEKADRRYAEALELASQQGWTIWALHCRYNAAYLRYLRGDAEGALGEMSSLRSTYEKAGDSRQAGKCLLNEAEILLEVGDMEGAARAAAGAKALACGLGLSLESGQALVYEAAAAIRLGRGRAEELLDEAAKHFGAERNDVWTAMARLQAAVLRSSSDPARALTEALAARDMLGASGLHNRRALADIVVGRIQTACGRSREAVESFHSALERAVDGRSQWMQFHASHELGATLADRNSGQARHHLLKADRLLDDLWSKLGSDDLKLAFLNDRESIYAPLVRLSLQESAESAFSFAEKARSRVLRESLGVGPIDPASLTASLDRDETIVEYFVDGADLLTFTLTRDGIRRLRRAKVVDALLSHIADFERHVASCSVKWEHLTGARRHLMLTAQAHLAELHRILVAPVESELRRRVVVIPHGFLHSVPFHGLWDGSRFLAEEHVVTYSPSAALYVSSAPPNESESAIFVAFSPDGGTTAAEEVLESAERVRGAVAVVNPSPGELRELFKKPHALVHIAGHAGIDPIGGRLSWIQTREGRLTSRELADLQIRARTVVLTGCQTARRTIRAGDEWQGLMRSFYLSGANAIVSALWDIRDRSAREFASEFYGRFNGGDVPAALNAAVAHIRSGQRHPYFWAGFAAFARKR